MSAEQNFPLLLRLLYPGLCSAVNSVSALPVFLSSRVKDALKNLGQTFFFFFFFFLKLLSDSTAAESPIDWLRLDQATEH